MRMNSLGEVASGAFHFDSKNAFRNQFPGAMAHNADAENALSFWVNNKFGHAVGAIKSESAAIGAPGEFRDFDGDVFAHSRPR